MRTLLKPFASVLQGVRIDYALASQDLFTQVCIKYYNRHIWEYFSSTCYMYNICLLRILINRPSFPYIMFTSASTDKPARAWHYLLTF
jgi:hypothetical protein